MYSTADFHPALGNLRTPPLHFRRRPPQSNCPPGSVPRPGHGRRLESQIIQGGISTLAPSNPEARLQSLPPILRRMIRDSLPNCSKGSWGLSVLPRVEGIFTPNTISLSPWSRQRRCCYAIRAGRNLPDKEFRSFPLTCFHERRTLSWLASIHLRGDLADSRETFAGQMLALFHHQEDVSKLE